MLIKRVLYVAFLYLIIVGGGGCTSLGADGSSASQENVGTSRNTGEEFLVVDCLFPPRTRHTGGLVMEIPRRPLKTTRQQCAMQGGRPGSPQEAWGPLAAEGDADAQLKLANDLVRGDQGAKDCRQAAALYQKVIAHGNPQQRASARFSLADLYETGCGVERARDRAGALYAEALDLQGTPPGPDTRRVNFGRFHALVIGNDRYRHLPQLTTAVNDARKVAEILTAKYGYTVKLLTDATREEILENMEALRRRLTEKDNLLIYYAGHGVIEDEQNKSGAWQPVDARRDSITHWIKTTDMTGIINIMLAPRVLIVSDSCFSGAWARSVFPDRYPEKVAYWIERLAQKRARLVLASGGLEPVPDRGGGEHSVFAKYLIEALEKNTDILIGRRLFDSLDKQVPFETSQEPVYAPMRHANHEGGEFFFERVDRAVSAGPWLNWRLVAAPERGASVRSGPN